MTIDKDRFESCQGSVALVSSIDCSTLSGTKAPRLTLQKRKMCLDRDLAPLTSVNSAFLSGLFADVAEAQVGSEDGGAAGEACPASVRPLKRSRVSLPGGMVRTATTLNLSGEAAPSEPSPASVLDLIDQALSPTTVTEIIQVQSRTVPFPQDLKNSNGSAGMPILKARDNTPSSRAGSIGPAFPHLPATISATSCNTLTRNLSDLQSSITENTEKESYGWFVEMDEEYVHETKAYDTTNTNDLAFKAPTAPKADNYDAELEWAKAADTVDDVLGDFF